MQISRSIHVLALSHRHTEQVVCALAKDDFVALPHPVLHF